MSKSNVKPVWIGGVAALFALALMMRLAIAITSFSPADVPVGYVGQDDLTSYNLKSGKEVLFRGQYEREFWGGNLIAYRMTADGDIDQATLKWNQGAAYQIELQGTDRRIVTLKSDGTRIPFVWGNLSAAQQAELGGSAPLLDYLRGDRSLEVQRGGSYRQRASPLGDIIHSRPFYLSDAGDPTPKPTVFVGANDGMLHAINAESGEERWAYVPSMLIKKMAKLADKAYKHDYYVDGSVNIANITVSGTTKRVLVGGLGYGGKGLYALDITGSARLAPVSEAAAANNILWEITPSTINNVANASYANLGYTYANPTIGKVKVAGTVRDVVIIGNGYNDGGDYQAYLYVIDPYTGALINAFKAGTSGTMASPNGLSTPAAIATGAAGEGIIDRVYAGDLNGTMWKFDLSDMPMQPSVPPSPRPLLVTSPAQPITVTPAVALHPNGGYMVNFATGAMLSAADLDVNNKPVFAAYGIWDGAPSENTGMLSQTLQERCYTSGVTAVPTPCTSRVRVVTTNNLPDWTPGADHHKGWKVDLPAGERVVGDGSFIENGRFYFTGYNPTVTTTVQSSVVQGETWLMELDYLKGGSQSAPFLDLSGSASTPLHVLNDDDRVKNSATPPAPIMGPEGIPVGRFIAIGVLSQPVLVQLSTLNNTLFNQNPDVPIAVFVADTGGGGVSNGHFDVDIYYGTTTAGAQATAKITVGTNGQFAGVPATLGAITVGGVTVVPAMTVLDITNGTASNANAATIAGKLINGFTATVSGNVITLKAPAGAMYNGKTISIDAGSSQSPQVAAVAGTPAVGSVKFTYAAADKAKNVTKLRILANGGTIYDGAPGSMAPRDLDNFLASLSFANYTITKDYNGDNSTVKIASKSNGSAWNGRISVEITTDGTPPGFTKVDLQGGSDDKPSQGFTNFAPALTTVAFDSKGVDPTSAGDACSSGGKTADACKSKQHIHQYDDEYDVTGVNMLNPSDTLLDIKNAIPSLTQNFKVIASNQYLSPAVKLHIGDPSYLFDIDFGYRKLKDYATSDPLDLADYQTYRRDPATVWTAVNPLAPTRAEKAQPKYIGSLAINMPVNALSYQDWWGDGNKRAGVHPTATGCVNKAVGTSDGNMYQPVIPPANNVPGPGTLGFPKGSPPTQRTAEGVRHNGALTIQVIRDTTPQDAIQQSVFGRPEYGWRVKAELSQTYLLAEWTVFWHHPNGKCYHQAGWTSDPGPDTKASTPSAKAPGSTDPHIGDLGGQGVGGGVIDVTVTNVTVQVTGNVTTTTIFYSGTTATATIVRTVKDDGSVTIVTTTKDGKRTEVTQANTEGSLRTGGDERGQSARVGRISWRELVAP